LDVAQVLAVWIHTLAFVIAWGYYGVLARMILPGLEQSIDRPGQVAALAAIERRALPLVVLSLVLFTVTGTYLLLVDPHYAGLGNFFASTWTALMLVKHVLVIALVALGVGVDMLIRRLTDSAGTSDETAQRSALRRVELAAEGVTGLGALIVLMTAAAQATA